MEDLGVGLLVFDHGCLQECAPFSDVGKKSEESDPPTSQMSVLSLAAVHYFCLTTHGTNVIQNLVPHEQIIT